MLEKAFEVLAVFKVVDEITKPINEMEKAVAGFKKSLENVSKSLEKLENAGKKMATFGAAITAPFAGAAYAAADFDKAMDEAATLVDMKLSEFRRLYDKQILQLAKETGQAPAIVARAFYQALSAGLKPDEAVKFLRDAGKSAIGGVSDIFTATDFFTTIRNAYHMTAKEFSKAKDVVFATIKLGKTTFQELAANFQYAGATAASAGVKFAELQAVVAELTAMGISTSRAYTGVGYAIENLVSPTDQAKKAFEKLGIEVNAVTLKKEGLIGTFEKIQKALQTLPEEMRSEYISKIFGSMEAQNIFKAFLTAPEKFKEVYGEILNSTGAADRAFEKMAKSASFKFSQMKASMQTLAISIGTLLLPPLNTLVETLNRLLSPLTSFIQAHQTLAKVLVYPAVGIGLLLTAFGSLAVAVGWVGKNVIEATKTVLDLAVAFRKSALWARLSAFAAMSWAEKIYAVVFSLARVFLPLAFNPYFLAFAVAATLIYKFWNPIKAFFSGLFQGLKEGFSEAFAPLKPVLSPVIGLFKSLFGWIGKILKPVDETSESLKKMASVGRTVGHVLVYALFPVLIPIKLLSWALSKLKGVFKELHDFVKSIDLFSHLKQGLLWLKEKLVFFGNWLKNHWQGVLKVFLWVNPITAPITALNKLVRFVSGINLFEAGKQIIEGLWKGIVSMAKKPIEAIENIGHSIKEKFKSLLGISSPSKLFMQFGHFLNEGLGLGLLKSLGLVKNAIGKVASALHLPKITPQVSIPKLTFEGLKALTLPVTLVASLLSPVSALSLPVKQVEKTFPTTKLERIVQVEKVLQAEKVLRERFISEKIATERIAEKPSTINLTLNFSPVINSENKEEVKQVLQAYLPDFVRQVEEAIRKIEEQRARRSY